MTNPVEKPLVVKGNLDDFDPNKDLLYYNFGKSGVELGIWKAEGKGFANTRLVRWYRNFRGQFNANTVASAVSVFTGQIMKDRKIDSVEKLIETQDLEYKLEIFKNRISRSKATINLNGLKILNEAIAEVKEQIKNTPELIQQQAANDQKNQDKALFAKFRQLNRAHKRQESSGDLLELSKTQKKSSVDERLVKYFDQNIGQLVANYHLNERLYPTILKSKLPDFRVDSLFEGTDKYRLLKINRALPIIFEYYVTQVAKEHCISLNNIILDEILKKYNEPRLLKDQFNEFLGEVDTEVFKSKVNEKIDSLMRDFKKRDIKHDFYINNREFFNQFGIQEDSLPQVMDTLEFTNGTIAKRNQIILEDVLHSVHTQFCQSEFFKEKCPSYNDFVVRVIPDNFNFNSGLSILFDLLRVNLEFVFLNVMTDSIEIPSDTKLPKFIDKVFQNIQILTNLHPFSGNLLQADFSQFSKKNLVDAIRMSTTVLGKAKATVLNFAAPAPEAATREKNFTSEGAISAPPKTSWFSWGKKKPVSNDQGLWKQFMAFHPNQSQAAH